MKAYLPAVLAFLLKLFLALFTAGSNDARTWEQDLHTLRTAGFAELYRSGVQYRSPEGSLSQRQIFSHPPAVLHGLWVLGRLQDRTGLPLRFWLRAACAVADVGTLALLWRIFGSVPLWVVLSPVSILISGFHGNTDPIMMFFLVAAVFFVGRGNTGWAGAAFGLACSVKLIPLILVPAVLLHLPGWRSRVRLLAVSAAVWIACSLPYLTLEPGLILRSLLGYGSATGLWGFSLLSTMLGAGGVYDLAAKWIALVAAAFAPLATKGPLFARCGLVCFTFLLLSPGFGLQYLAWTAPWTVLPDRAMAAYHLIIGAAALAIYTAAAESTSAGVYADLLNPRSFPVLILMGLICWITIGAGMATLWVDRSPAPPTRLGGRENIA